MGIKVGDVLMYLGIVPGNFHEEMRKVKDDQDALAKKNKEVTDTLKAVGAMMAAVGAGGLLVAASARKTNADLGALAITTGHTTKEMKDLVLSTTDVGLGIKELTSTFEQLARAGEHNLDNLKVEAKAFDALGHATNQEADTVTAMLLPAYKSLNIELPKTANGFDSLTWLVHNTTVDVGDFAGAMSWVAREGETLNVTMDDMVAMLAALADRGITGTVAIRTFRSAVTEAVSKNESLAKALNITQAEIDGYKAKLQSASGITQKYADAAETQYGIMDRLKQTWSELTLRAGTFLEPLEPILALMTALGPVMIFFSTAVGLTTLNMVKGAIAQAGYIVVMTAWRIALGLATAAQWALNVAMDANPIGVIILAVAALTAAIYGLVKGIQWLIGSKKEDTLATMGQTKAEREHAQAVADAKDKVESLTAWQEQLTKSIADAKTKLQDAKDSSGGYASQIQFLEHNLTNTNYALDQAKDKLSTIQTSYDAAATKVKGFEDAISDANSELDKLSSPNLTGMQAYDDQIFAVQQQIKKAELAQLQGDKSKTREQEIKALQNQLNILEHQRDITYDPLTRSAKESVETIQGLNNEVAPETVMSRIAALGNKLGPDGELTAGLSKAKDAMEKQNLLLTDQQKIVDGLTAAAKGYSDELAAIASILESIYYPLEQQILSLETRLAGVKAETDAAATNLANVSQNRTPEGLLLPPTAEGSSASKDAYWIDYFKRIKNGENLPPPTNLTPEEIAYYKGLANGQSLPPLKAHVSGGWLTEPTLLVSMRNMRPYGTAVENGRPEYINPAGSGANSGAIDSSKIIDAINRGFDNVSIRVQIGAKDVASEIFREGKSMKLTRI